MSDFIKQTAKDYDVELELVQELYKELENINKDLS